MSRNQDAARGGFSLLPLENKFNSVLAHNRRLMEDNIRLGDEAIEREKRIDFLEGRRTELEYGAQVTRGIIVGLEGHKTEAQALRHENGRLRRRIKYLESVVARSETATMIEQHELTIADQDRKIKDLQRVIRTLK